MASTLLAAGLRVLVHSRSSRRVGELVAAGALAAPDAASLGSGADIVVLSLPDAGDVREVLLGDGGVATVADPPRLVIDTSTIAPEDARAIAADLGSAGVAYIDAPVSGGPTAAATGSLSVMVGGAEEHVAAAREVLEVIGARVAHCGGVGAGQVCKACNQLIVMGTIELVAEALVLATRAGLDPATVREALMAGYASSRILELHGKRMIDRDFEPGGKAVFNMKDIRIIAGLAAAAELELPAFDAAALQVERLIGADGGELDNAALITVVEGRA